MNIGESEEGPSERIPTDDRGEGWETFAGNHDEESADCAGEEGCGGERGETKGEAGRQIAYRAIYSLTDSGGRVFYIGKTSKPKQRLQAHRVNHGNDIALNILQDSFGSGSPDEAERWWIQHHIAIGCELANERLVNPPKIPAVRDELPCGREEFAACQSAEDLLAFFRKVGRNGGIKGGSKGGKVDGKRSLVTMTPEERKETRA